MYRDVKLLRCLPALALGLLLHAAPSATAASLAQIASAAEDSTVQAASVGPAHESLLGSRAVVVRGGRGVRRWRAVANRLNEQEAILRRCLASAQSCTAKGLVGWRRVVAGLRHEGDTAVLHAVNDFFNAVPYRDDQDLYGEADHWATPTEFLRNGGDCEDYAIAKYATLRVLGYPEAALRVVVVRDVDRQLNHAVLAVTLRGVTRILDSSTNLIYRSQPDTIYRPIIAFNMNSTWLYSPNPQKAHEIRIADTSFGANWIPLAAEEERDTRR